MPNTEIDRPKAPEKKVSTANDFELCFLRHQYLRRVKYNPTEEEMSPYIWIVDNITKKTCSVYANLFRSVGLDQEDAFSIGTVHLVSFLGLYALEQTKKKKKEFLVKFEINNEREPTESEILDKNKANFTCFLKQRMEDLVRVCRQKSRNIKAQKGEEYAVFCGKSSPPKYIKNILKNHRELGFKKIEFSVFKSIRKKAGVDNTATGFIFGGVWYIAIALEQKNLEIDDIVSSDANPYVNEHNMQPDELYGHLPISLSSWNKTVKEKDKEFLIVKEERESDHFIKLFNGKSGYRKRVILQNFIAKNKNAVYYKEEVATAQRMLKNLGGWIR